MKMIPHIRLMLAYRSYHQHAGSDHFWKYLGKRGNYHMQWHSWEVTTEAARKVDLLLGPYAEVLLKAWKCQNETSASTK